MNADLYRAVLIGVQLTVLAWIVWHDVRTLIAPNRYVYPALALSLLAVVPLGLDATIAVWLGALAAFAAMLALALLSRGAMGLGDTKVGALCGAIVGLQGVVPMLTLTFVAGGLVSVVLLVVRVRRRADAIAYTPFLAAGVIGTLWFASPTI